MMYWNGHMTAAGWTVAIIWTVIIFALIAGAIYWLAMALRGPSASATRPAEASGREILDRRLAKGELTIDQYRELRAAIEAHAPSQPQEGGRPLPSPPAAGAPG